MLNWYLVYTKPKSEDTVSRKLLDAGFETLNPKVRERRYLRRKAQVVVSSLFPCYVFVRFDLFRSYRLVKYTRGIRRIVGNEGMPTVVSEDSISSIRERSRDGYVTITPARLDPGEEVYVGGGPFEGFNAIFERELKGHERVVVLLKTINARVVIDRSVLEKTNITR